MHPAMSIDVIYHVIDQLDYEQHLRLLFERSKYSLLYAANGPKSSATPHIVFRNDLEEISRLGFKTQLIERHPL